MGESETQSAVGSFRTWYQHPPVLATAGTGGLVLTRAQVGWQYGPHIYENFGPHQNSSLAEMLATCKEKGADLLLLSDHWDSEMGADLCPDDEVRRLLNHLAAYHAILPKDYADHIGQEIALIESALCEGEGAALVRVALCDGFAGETFGELKAWLAEQDRNCLTLWNAPGLHSDWPKRKRGTWTADGAKERQQHASLSTSGA